MSAKRTFFGVLIVGGMLAGVASAQSMLPPAGGPAGNSGVSYGIPPISGPGPMSSSPGPVSPYAQGPATLLDSPTPMPENPYQFNPVPGSAAESWASGLGSLPIGRDGPIGQELYFWNGPSIPIGGGILSKQLNTGWMAEAGGKALLFNASNTSAWVARAGLTFQYNDGSGNVKPFDYFGFPVRIRDYFRWSGTYAVGRDWFLIGQSPFGPRNTNLRYGFDVGGRWGTSHVNLNLNINDPLMQSNYLRRHDVFGGFEIGSHLDLEVPIGGWVWVVGIRSEWGYDFTDIMPAQKSNIQDVNLLFTTGIRY